MSQLIGTIFHSGVRPKSKTFKRQVVELNVRISILNRFTELSSPETVAVG